VSAVAEVILKLGLARPMPHRQVSDPDEVAQLRRLNCRRYDECLDRAASARWDGFHCLDCGAFDRMTAEEEARDARALLRFWTQSPRRLDVHVQRDRATNHLTEEH
jgi:hypothetical protein